MSWWDGTTEPEWIFTHCSNISLSFWTSKWCRMETANIAWSFHYIITTWSFGTLVSLCVQVHSKWKRQNERQKWEKSVPSYTALTDLRPVSRTLINEKLTYHSLILFQTGRWLVRLLVNFFDSDLWSVNVKEHSSWNIFQVSQLISVRETRVDYFKIMTCLIF